MTERERDEESSIEAHLSRLANSSAGQCCARATMPARVIELLCATSRRRSSVHRVAMAVRSASSTAHWLRLSWWSAVNLATWTREARGSEQPERSTEVREMIESGRVRTAPDGRHGQLCKKALCEEVIAGQVLN